MKKLVPIMTLQEAARAHDVALSIHRIAKPEETAALITSSTPKRLVSGTAPPDYSWLEEDAPVQDGIDSWDGNYFTNDF